VCNAICRDGILERLKDVILSNDFVPFFRSVFSVECL
jgi:hypothetical protein